MSQPPDRRALLRFVASVPFLGASTWVPGCAIAASAAAGHLAALELSSGGRLGVAALNTSNGAQVNHRSDERFAFCSTFKVIAAAAILKRSATESGLMQRRLVYRHDELVAYSPITEKHAGEGLTVSELCAAALQYSDNTAANLMIRLLGGPAAVTSFARSIGDGAFRLDRWETALNEALPGDPRDTSTPAAMMGSLQRLALGDALEVPERTQLVAWMRGSTTGAKRIRAGVPAGWSVADKTGTGDYGTTNDIGLVWPPGKLPIVLAIYFTQREKAALPRDDVVATAARIVMAASTMKNPADRGESKKL
ncbi:MAG: class A beta-lactamase [Proteobacteria bacterium]|nr:class A beta-lactamase [Burkholderiales bacterium]